MSFLSKDLKSELLASSTHLTTRCNKKSFLAFSINNILSSSSVVGNGEQNNNKNDERQQKQEEEDDQSKDEVR